MRDFPSCFGENGVQVADFSSSNNGKTAQNLVTCVYQCRLRGRSCLISVTWSKNLMGQGLSVGIDDSSNHCLCKVDIKPWLFSKRRGSKSLEAYSCKIDIYWDLSSAKFVSGPEPLEGYYVGIVVDKQMVLLLGDLRKEAFKKSNSSPVPSSAVFISKKEHIFGKKVFCSKAQFCDNGQIHDIAIECDTNGISEPCLILRVDSKMVLQVKRLQWKFRGNHTILVEGLAVEVFWDVHSWLFSSSPGNAVFMFKTCLSAEKLWGNQPVCDPNALSWSFSQRFSDSKSQGASAGADKQGLAVWLVMPTVVIYACLFSVFRFTTFIAMDDLQKSMILLKGCTFSGKSITTQIITSNTVFRGLLDVTFYNFRLDPFASSLGSLRPQVSAFHDEAAIRFRL